MEARTELRCDQLAEMGLRFNGQSYVGYGGNSDINFHFTEIQFDLDKDWNEKIDKVEKEMKRREEIRKAAVPKCSFCGKNEVCPGAFPEGCFLENDRDIVSVFEQ